MAWTGVPKAALRWNFTRKEPFVYRSFVGDTNISIGERTCCGSCGCNISLQYYLYPEKTHIAAPTIEKNDFEALKVGCHIWIKHVPEWYTIPVDGIERFQDFDDDFQSKLDEYLKGASAPENGGAPNNAAEKTAKLNQKGGWWAGMLPGDSPDYSAIKGPDTLTMADLWDDPTKVRSPLPAND